MSPNDSLLAWSIAGLSPRRQHRTGERKTIKGRNFVALLKGTGEVTAGAAEAAQDGIKSALEGATDVASSTLGAVSGVAGGALDAVGEVGTGLVNVVRGTVVGVVKGLGEIATVTVRVISDTVRTALREPTRPAAMLLPPHPVSLRV